MCHSDGFRVRNFYMLENQKDGNYRRFRVRNLICVECDWFVGIMWSANELEVGWGWKGNGWFEGWGGWFLWDPRGAKRLRTLVILLESL